MLGEKPLPDVEKLAAGYGVYLVLLVATFSSRKRNPYATCFVILCLLLAVNAVGCQRFWKASAGAH